jgi:hypothetical protein
MIEKDRIIIENDETDLVKYVNTIKDSNMILLDKITDNNIQFDVSTEKPTVIVTYGNTGPYVGTNTMIQPAIVEINGFENDKSECNIYSTSGTGLLRYPDNFGLSPYVMMNNYAEIGNGTSTTVGGIYADYSDGANLTRYFQGFNAPLTGVPVPMMGALQFVGPTGPQTLVPVTSASPITFIGSDSSLCTVTAASHGLSLQGGASIISDTAGAVVKYMTIKVDGTSYKVPLHALA